MGDKLAVAIIVRKSMQLGNHNFSVATINANSTIPSASVMQLRFLPITHQMGFLLLCELLMSTPLLGAQKQTTRLLNMLVFFFFFFFKVKHLKWLSCKTTLFKRKWALEKLLHSLQLSENGATKSDIIGHNNHKKIPQNPGRTEKKPDKLVWRNSRGDETWKLELKQPALISEASLKLKCVQFQKLHFCGNVHVHFLYYIWQLLIWNECWYSGIYCSHPS